VADSDDRTVNRPESGGRGKLVVVSNRLPVVLSKKTGSWVSEPGSGGLVTALAPVLKDRGGLWIGWPGTGPENGIDEALESATEGAGYSLVAVPLNRREIERHYKGFSNEVIWPLFHDLQTMCNFDPEYWITYREVNRKFAGVIDVHARPEDLVWVHDYHLLLAAAEMRALGVRSRTGFFLHIPFPSPDIFVKLPWRSEILEGMLEYDILGFQTVRDRRNFIQCLRMLTGSAYVRGRGQVYEIKSRSKRLRAGVFPISIDYCRFERDAMSEEVAKSAWHIHENLPDRQIILGIDRMDYTKGIPSRLKAFRHLLREHPEHRDRVTLVQVVVPSRRGIPGYEDLKTEIEQLVGEINGEFTGAAGWVPIHYIYRPLNRLELLGYYRASEVALITPLKDGMNLVAKEYCACSMEENCVLILSEFAGAAAEFQEGALLVNPYDIVAVADTMNAALRMKPQERQQRMRRLRKVVRRRDIFWWVDSFLEASIAKSLDNFPRVADYIPDSRHERGKSGRRR
jgi:trehalose 6-phosphate synthase/phosphatase